MSELSREEALVALDRRVAELEERYYEVYAWQGKANGRFIALEGKSALTGSAGTGGGEKDAARPDSLDFRWSIQDFDGVHARFAEKNARNAEAERTYALSLESRLAAAEKALADAKNDRDAYADVSVGLAAERDALKAELAEAKNAVKTEYHRGYGDYRRDLDAALARVNELEAAQERIMAVWMNLDINAMVSALQDASVRIKYIRDAAGAQP